MSASFADTSGGSSVGVTFPTLATRPSKLCAGRSSTADGVSPGLVPPSVIHLITVLSAPIGGGGIQHGIGNGAHCVHYLRTSSCFELCSRAIFAKHARSYLPILPQRKHCVLPGTVVCCLWAFGRAWRYLPSSLRGPFIAFPPLPLASLDARPSYARDGVKYKHARFLDLRLPRVPLRQQSVIIPPLHYARLTTNSKVSVALETRRDTRLISCPARCPS
ncbi:hypothetical protein TRVL_09291 [Trypanosoma vivax]|nr:hypothetical protein TRVL_09291 [Trypanosoma vivax]